MFKFPVLLLEWLSIPGVGYSFVKVFLLFSSPFSTLFFCRKFFSEPTKKINRTTILYFSVFFHKFWSEKVRLNFHVINLLFCLFLPFHPALLFLFTFCHSFWLFPNNVRFLFITICTRSSFMHLMHLNQSG